MTTAAHWILTASIVILILWAFVLEFGTPREKELATAFVVISPIPPIP